MSSHTASLDEDRSYEEIYSQGVIVDHDPNLDHSVRIKEVKKSFGSFDVLTGLNLNFVDDAITTVLGPSGTGKSVLLKHIVGLLEPDSGVVEVLGQDMWSINAKERQEIRKRMGILFQDGALFGSMNIYDNVAFPLRKHTTKRESEIRKIVMGHLDEVGLARAVTKFPGEVSGGMKKRAGFARALVLNPSVVMFDEPDSGLDPVRTSLLNDLILKMHAEHGGTYVLVTHDIRTARKVSDYVGVVWQGKLIHYGETEEAFNSDMPFVRQFLSGDSVGPLGMD
ncbi:ABC transporter ATP-binding protein [Nocardioides sp. NPDC057767]|jgi:phospholipid/cholesterol/gamma-HCH transport system ATP-binding protein|uniref:Phospholipid/cholesterol/gamma-HCH transport system ATP-binding protein n=1 Tax=Nocardioides panzhihuensis TaxID=860243 RepID=A0A7Z0ISV3_9ACTN|nr:ATP-binding cassette domain-containing protein [Nocardioides panzhihuensis]NYI78260.1 phospholipid/cholesterol/gamma-HCH transport system ATP-binding protein [Nocardioides panzhihuensis]